MFFVGVDLGQRRDFSAIAVVERKRSAGAFDYVSWRPREMERDLLVVRYLERMRLGTLYSEVAKRVAEIAQHPAVNGPRRVIVDATGVGMPVMEMMRLSRPGCEVSPVVITGGVMEHYDRGLWHVPRKDLLGGLQRAQECGELKIAAGMKEADTLVRELAGAVAGGHDDLVFAVALACWPARKGFVGHQGKRLV